MKRSKGRKARKGRVVQCPACHVSLRKYRLEQHQAHPECRLYQTLLHMKENGYVKVKNNWLVMDLSGLTRWAFTQYFLDLTDWDRKKYKSHRQDPKCFLRHPQRWCYDWAFKLNNRLLEIPALKTAVYKRAVLLRASLNPQTRVYVEDDPMVALDMILDRQTEHGRW